MAYLNIHTKLKGEHFLRVKVDLVYVLMVSFTISSDYTTVIVPKHMYYISITSCSFQ